MKPAQLLLAAKANLLAASGTGEPSTAAASAEEEKGSQRI